MSIKILRNKGVAIIQGLILAGIVAAASAMVVNYTSLQKQSTRKSTNNALGNKLSLAVSGLLSTKDFCERTFAAGAVNFAGANGVNQAFNILDPAGVKVFGGAGGGTPATRIGNMTINTVNMDWTRVGGNIELTRVAVNYQYNEGAGVYNFVKNADVSQLPLINAATRECIYNNNSAVTQATEAACESLGGTPSNTLGVIRCQLDNNGAAIDLTATPEPAGRPEYRQTGIDLISSEVYYDSRFVIKVPPAAVTNQDFQGDKGLVVDSLQVPAGATESTSLLNVRQVRKAVQTYCLRNFPAAAGEVIMGIITAAGISCQNVSCPAGQYFAGIDNGGLVTCRRIFANPPSCPDGSFYNLTSNAQQQAAVTCCDPDCSGAGGYPLGVIYNSPNGCGVCTGENTFNRYNCVIDDRVSITNGRWELAVRPSGGNATVCRDSGNNYGTFTYDCTGGAYLDGQSLCCNTAPTALCSPRNINYTDYLCDDAVWRIQGSCGGPDDGICPGGTANHTDNICCAQAPDATCRQAFESYPCNNGVWGAPSINTSCTSRSAGCSSANASGSTVPCCDVHPTTIGGTCQAIPPGQCSPAYNGGTFANLNSGDPICSAGSSPDFATTAAPDGWSWTCVTGGGSSGPCSATRSAAPVVGLSISSTAPNGADSGRVTLNGGNAGENITLNIEITQIVETIPGGAAGTSFTAGTGTATNVTTTASTPVTLNGSTTLLNYSAIIPATVSSMQVVITIIARSSADPIPSPASTTINYIGAPASLTEYTCSGTSWINPGACSYATEDTECTSGTPVVSGNTICCYADPSTTGGACGVPNTYSRWTCPAAGGNWSGPGAACSGPDSAGCGNGALNLTSTDPALCCDDTMAGQPASSCVTACTNDGSSANARIDCCSNQFLAPHTNMNLCPGGQTCICGNPGPVTGICRGYAGTYSVEPATSTTNACTAGTFANTPADTPTQWNWTCQGANGGSDTACSANRSAVVNGACRAYPGDQATQPATNTTNACVTGTYADSGDSGTQWRWFCRGSGGGSDASCSATISTVENGRCQGFSGTHTSQPANSSNGCIAGNYSDTGDTPTQFRWSCLGIGTGATNANCSASQSAPYTHYFCDSGMLDVGGQCTAAQVASLGCRAPSGPGDPTGHDMCCQSPPDASWCNPPRGGNRGGPNPGSCPSNICTGGSNCIGYCPSGRGCAIYRGNCPATATNCTSICTSAGNHACYGAGGTTDGITGACF